jgi:hypothetical protein
MNDYFELFLSLISSFLSGSTDPAAFKAEYMKLWRECRDMGVLSSLNATTEQAFDRIFTASDCYCENPTLRDARDWDERQFTKEVATIARDVRR